MGEVNVIEVRRNGNGSWHGVDVPGSFEVTPPAGAPDAETACIVVRPEFLRFIGDGESAENRLEGTVYNEYSLGSRIQYQVRVGEKVMLVELSRARALPTDTDRKVTVGWDAADAITVRN